MVVAENSFLCCQLPAQEHLQLWHTLLSSSSSSTQQSALIGFVGHA